MTATWTEAETERVMTLWADGRSATEISKRLLTEFHIHYSRNAVIGKVWRMSLSSRGRAANPLARPYVSDKRIPKPPKARDAAQKVTRAIKVARAVKIARAVVEKLPPAPTFVRSPVPVAGTPIKAPLAADIPITAKSWLDRKSGECAFPVDGEGADTRSCCGKTDGSTYCDPHRLVMYVDGRPAKLRAYWPKDLAA